MRRALQAGLRTCSLRRLVSDKRQRIIKKLRHSVITFTGSTHAIRSNQRILGQLFDLLHCCEIHFADARACVRFLLNTSKLLLGPAFERRMDRLSAHLKIASNGLSIPSIRVKPNDGSATFCAILDVCIAWKAAFGGRWFVARSQDELDGGRGGV